MSTPTTDLSAPPEPKPLQRKGDLVFAGVLHFSRAQQPAPAVATSRRGAGIPGYDTPRPIPHGISPQAQQADQRIRVGMRVVDDHHEAGILRSQRVGDLGLVPAHQEEPRPSFADEMLQQERLAGPRLSGEHTISRGRPQPGQVILSADWSQIQTRPFREGYNRQRTR